MPTKADLPKWVHDALAQNGGRASIIDVCRHIWQAHEGELRAAGGLFYTWQYDVRWAAYQLRAAGIIKAAERSPRGVWELS
jgi:hypothetical protein